MENETTLAEVKEAKKSVEDLFQSAIEELEKQYSVEVDSVLLFRHEGEVTVTLKVNI